MNSVGFSPPVGGQNNRQLYGTSRVRGNSTVTSDCIQTYKSVPPRPLCYTMVDMLESAGHEKRRVSTNSPKDFEKRFRYKPATKPKIVDFTSSEILPNMGKYRNNGFYPPDKLRIRRYIRSPTNQQTVGPEQLTMNESTPSSYSGSTVTSTPESDITAKSIAYLSTASEDTNFNDLSYLHPPHRLAPRREVPWVFRFKVKRGMNELSKIMASKSQTAATPDVL